MWLFNQMTITSFQSKTPLTDPFTTGRSDTNDEINTEFTPPHHIYTRVTAILPSSMVFLSSYINHIFIDISIISNHISIVLSVEAML